MGIVGWLLVKDSYRDPRVYMDITNDQGVQKSIELTDMMSEMSENTYQSLSAENAAEIVAATGYELRGRSSMDGLTVGDYEMTLRVEDAASGASERIAGARFSIIGNRAENIDTYNEDMGAVAPRSVLDLEAGYAIGLDELAEGASYPAGQILLPGWLNAPANTELSVILSIDGQLYTTNEILDMGGEIAIHNAPRDLSGIGADVRGPVYYDEHPRGFIVELALPFLSAGEHTIAPTFNIGMPGKEAFLVDLRPVSIEIEAGMQIDEGIVDETLNAWASKFAAPETEGEGE